MEIYHYKTIRNKQHYWKNIARWFSLVMITQTQGKLSFECIWSQLSIFCPEARKLGSPFIPQHTLESHALIQMLSFKWLHFRIKFTGSKVRAVHFSIINRTVRKGFLSRGFSTVSVEVSSADPENERYCSPFHLNDRTLGI